MRTSFSWSSVSKTPRFILESISVRNTPECCLISCWTLCENTQRGVASRAWTPGPYSELESQLAAFDRQYLRAMGESPPLKVAQR